MESLPNRDIFEDIYPESDKDKSDSDSNDDSEYEEERERGLKMLDAESRLREVQDSLDLANEKVASAASRLKILDSYGTSLHERKEGVNIQQELLNYKREREQTFTDHVAGSQTRRELKEQVQKIRREIAKITRQETKKSAPKKIKPKKRLGSRGRRKNLLSVREIKSRKKRRLESVLSVKSSGRNTATLCASRSSTTTTLHFLPAEDHLQATQKWCRYLRLRLRRLTR